MALCKNIKVFWMSPTQGLYFRVEDWNNSVSLIVMFCHVFLDLQMNFLAFSCLNLC